MCGAVCRNACVMYENAEVGATGEPEERARHCAETVWYSGLWTLTGSGRAHWHSGQSGEGRVEVDAQQVREGDVCQIAAIVWTDGGADGYVHTSLDDSEGRAHVWWCNGMRERCVSCAGRR